LWAGARLAILRAEGALKTPDYLDPVYRAALAEQSRLRERLVAEPLPREVRLIAGADVSSEFHGRTFWGGLVVCDALEGFRPVCSAVVRKEVDFPYIPGLLAFRELPALSEAYARLRVKPDATLVDAQGTAHPRRFGAAAHLGVVLDAPTVGCAKSLLCGEHEEPGGRRGDWSALVHEGEVVGRVLRTRSGVAPVFVSPGHRSDLESAAVLVLACAPRYRIPEPIRLAHQLVNEARRNSQE
jgi:deoxyribonuclease V